MSVANIIDPQTGKIDRKFIPGSSFVENEVIPFDSPITYTLPVGNVGLYLPESITPIVPGQVLQVSGFYSLVASSAAPGSRMAFWAVINGNPIGDRNLTIWEGDGSTEPIVGTFNFFIRNPTDFNQLPQTQFSLYLGDDGARVATLTLIVQGLSINTVLE